MQSRKPLHCRHRLPVGVFYKQFGYSGTGRSLTSAFVQYGRPLHFDVVSVPHRATRHHVVVVALLKPLELGPTPEAADRVLEVRVGALTKHRVILHRRRAAALCKRFATVTHCYRPAQLVHQAHSQLMLLGGEGWGVNL